VHRVLLLPRRGFHLVEARAHDDLDIASAEPARRAAAIHRGIAAAEHDDARLDLPDMPERDRREPVDADVDLRGRLAAPGNLEVAPARRAAADEDRVVAFVEQRLHRRDRRAGAEVDAEIEDVAAFLVDHRFGQPEARDLRADEPARLRLAVVDRDRITERRQVARDRQARGAGADAGDPLAVARRRSRQPRADIVLQVGGDALQAADRDRLGARAELVAVLDAAAPARRLARAVAGAPEDPGEHVRNPVDHIGVGVTPLGDQPDVMRNGRVGRAGPLAVDDLVEVRRVAHAGGLHALSPSSWPHSTTAVVVAVPPGLGRRTHRKGQKSTPDASQRRRRALLQTTLSWSPCTSAQRPASGRGRSTSA
jgi:hypothetical protein